MKAYKKYQIALCQDHDLISDNDHVKVELTVEIDQTYRAVHITDGSSQKKVFNAISECFFDIAGMVLVKAQFSSDKPYSGLVGAGDKVASTMRKSPPRDPVKPFPAGSIFLLRSKIANFLVKLASRVRPKPLTDLMDKMEKIIIFGAGK